MFFYTFLNNCTLAHSRTDDTHRGQFGVQYLVQGHFDMGTGGAGDRTATHSSGWWGTALPPEPQLIYTWSLIRIKMKIKAGADGNAFSLAGIWS